MPKAGGTSFKFFLKENFGDQLYLDYTDYPDHLTPDEVKHKIDNYENSLYQLKPIYFNYLRKKIFHGHFLAAKYKVYLKKKDACFITWLRNPIERLASQYHYWKRTYQPDKSLRLHKKMIEENWSFEEFCFSEEMRNLYSKFLLKFNKEDFDFIGIVEHFEEDFEYLAKEILKIDNPKLPSLNKNPKSTKSYFEDNDLKQKLMDFHKKDFEIYNYALDKREKRLRGNE
jgi:hypothetical protein